MKVMIQWHKAFRWFLLLTLTGYAPGAWSAEAGNVTAPPPASTADFENLRSLLKTRGWRVEQTADGSTLLFPLHGTPQAAGAGNVTAPPPASTADFENLRSLLETRGWRVEQTADGSTLLFPLHGTPPQAAGAENVAAPPPATTDDFENLRSLLETRGWRVEQTADGSTLLFPLHGTPPQAAGAENVAAPPPATTDDFENLRNLLKTRGWRVEQTADGSTLLFPLRNTPQGQGNTSPLQTPAPASITLTVSPEDMPQLHALLEAYSWNMVEKGSNALDLLAPAQHHTLAAAVKADCTEDSLDLMLTAGITLPVNSAEEAWQISDNWLWASGYTDLRVGNIRSSGWIYLVDIVDQIPPYRSRNGLIINKQSGQLLPLY